MTNAEDALSTGGAPAPLLTEAEVAHRLRCTTRTVANLVSRGELRSVRLGRRLTRYRPEDVEQLLAARTERVSA